MMVPLPIGPKDTAVALARPPPKMVMAPEPLMGPVFGLRPDTDGQPSPPWRAKARLGSTGEPSPLVGVVAGGRRGTAPPLVIGEVVVPRGDVGEVRALFDCVERRADPTQRGWRSPDWCRSGSRPWSGRRCWCRRNRPSRRSNRPRPRPSSGSPGYDDVGHGAAAGADRRRGYPAPPPPAGPGCAARRRSSRRRWRRRPELVP